MVHIKFKHLPKPLQDRLDGIEDLAGIERVKVCSETQFSVRFQLGAEYWYKYYHPDGTDAGGTIHYYAKDPEMIEAGNSTESERGFY